MRLSITAVRNDILPGRPAHTPCVEPVESRPARSHTRLRRASPQVPTGRQVLPGARCVRLRCSCSGPVRVPNDLKWCSQCLQLFSALT